MKLTILGSGTCLPSLTRNSPGYYLEIGNKKIILDSASGTLRQLFKAGIDYENIDLMVYSHSHPDHISDLMSILQGILVKTYHDPKGRTKDLILAGGKDFKKIYKNIRESQKIPKEPYKVLVNELKKKNIIDHIEIYSEKAEHEKDSIFIKFKYKNKILVYTGDTGYSKKLIKFSKNADLLLADCSHPNGKEMKGHMTPKECGIVAKKAKVRKLVLTHFYPDCENIDIKKQAQKEFDGEIILARDLMEFEI